MSTTGSNQQDSKHTMDKRPKLKHTPIKWKVNRKYRKSCKQIYSTLLSIDWVQQELTAPELSKVIAEYGSSQIKNVNGTRIRRENSTFNLMMKGILFVPTDFIH